MSVAPVRQYGRSVGIGFGPASPVTAAVLSAGGAPALGRPTIGNFNDDGIRIAFQFERSATSEPDRGLVQLFNLTRSTAASIVQDKDFLDLDRRNAFKLGAALPRPPSSVISNALKAANAGHQVQFFAGYGQNPEVIFLGDYVRVTERKRISQTDWVTEIELGDSFLSLRDGFMDSPLGLGMSVSQLVQEFSSATGIRTSADAAAKISAVAPTATVTLMANGAAGGIRAAEWMDDIAQLLGMTWTVREGELFFLRNDQYLLDFAIQLVQGRDLLAFDTRRDNKDIAGTALMNSQIVPGRVLVILDENLTPVTPTGYAVRACRYSGDTHGQPFYVEFEATLITGAVPAVVPLTG